MMNTFRSWVNKHSFVIFLGLTFILSWWPWPLYIMGSFPFAVFPPGPMLAALIVVPLADGWTGLKNLGRTTFRWRVGLRWYAIAISFPIVLTAIPAGVNILLGASASTAHWPTSLSAFLGEYVAIFVLVGLGEEVGFSSFSLPRLLSGRSVLVTVGIMALTRVIWHLPSFMTGETEWPVALLLIPTQLIFTWIFIRSGSSALLMVLAHCSVAAIGYLFTGMFSGADMTQVVWLQAAAFVIAGIVLLLTSDFWHASSYTPETAVEDDIQTAAS